MDERSATVRLASQGRPEARGVVATLRRHEIEEALRADEPVDLLLDIDRVGDGGIERERIALGWETEDLEKVLASSTGDEVALTFDEEDLRRLLDADVEAHGMREKLAVVTAVAGIAAAGAGTAAAHTMAGGAGSGTAVPAAAHATASEMSAGLTGSAPVAASEISSGLDVQTADGGGRAATASEISTGITQQAPVAASEISSGMTQEPRVAAAEVTTGVVAHPTATPASASPKTTWRPDAAETALAVGAILALTAAGFAVRSHRHRPAT